VKNVEVSKESAEGLLRCGDVHGATLRMVCDLLETFDDLGVTAVVVLKQPGGRIDMGINVTRAEADEMLHEAIKAGAGKA
jgi:hypothetical protein